MKISQNNLTVSPLEAYKTLTRSIEAFEFLRDPFQWRKFRPSDIVPSFFARTAPGITNFVAKESYAHRSPLMPRQKL